MNRTISDISLCDQHVVDAMTVQRLLKTMLAPELVESLAETFKVLGDPTRVKILHALLHGELCVCDLSAVLGMTPSAVSHQLRLLRSLRLVKTRRDGKVVFYSMDDEHIIGLFAEGLRHVRHR